MLEDKIQLIMDIGDEICEGCGPDRDCEEEIDDCFRIANAIDYLDEYINRRDNGLWQR